MAPGTGLPSIDMESLQTADIQQSYWLLFQHMIKDFVHKQDLIAILAANTVVGASPAGPVTGITTFLNPTLDLVARSVAIGYKVAADTGEAFTKTSISTMEKLTK